MDSRRKWERKTGSRSLPMKRPSSSKSFASSSHSRVRSCDCGDELLLLTSKTSNNLGRVFWRCANWGRNNTMHYSDHQVEEILKKNWKLQKKVGTKCGKAIFFGL
ncbi:hypothetical protein SESBI_32868 [Sesbania bispinosa]|nr:hypothetical protein SESBI_32868 [Sesbania bispinosa]